MKRMIAALAAAVILFCNAVNADGIVPSVNASAVALMYAENGELIYGQNADAQLPVASLTKIMTAVVALENASLDDVICVDRRACGIEGSSVYLTPGENLSVEDLLYALMLQSANDAASALAYGISGSIEDFSVLMNQKAEDLGLMNTHFTNPHGLDEEEHYSSARDLAALTVYALDNPDFLQIVSTYKRELPFKDDPAGRVVYNHNRLLRTYDGCVGVKTGYTMRCGRCLVSAAERNGITIVCVTLNDPDDWRDHKALLDYAFDAYTLYTPAQADREFFVHVISGVKDSLKCIADISPFLVRTTDVSGIDREIRMKKFYYAPVKNGEILGSVVYSIDGEIVASFEIKASENCDKIKYRRNIFEIIRSWFG